MKPIRILTHAESKPMGYLSALLDRLGYPYEQVDLFHEKSVPQDTDQISALVFMGGAGNVNLPSNSMVQEMELIQRAEKNGVPILGICLGAQLMSKALGGQVWEAERLEVGWHEVSVLPRTRTHPFLDGLPDKFTAFHWHAHVCTPPPGGETVMFNHFTEDQAYVYHKHLAIQFHLEMTEEKVRLLTEQYASDFEDVSESVQSGEEILANLPSRCNHTFSIADKLFANWFSTLT